MPINKPYSEVKKIEVVTTYLALGKAPMVEAVTGVPRQTIRVWKMQPWWKELVDEIQSDETQELSSKLTKIIDRSLDVVVDRIEHGDFLLDSRTGQVRRVPVKLRDVHRVSTDLIDKRQLLKKKQNIESDKSTVEDIMKKLAGQFSEFVQLQVKKDKEKVIEGSYSIGEDTGTILTLCDTDMDKESLAQSENLTGDNTDPIEGEIIDFKLENRIS